MVERTGAVVTVTMNRPTRTGRASGWAPLGPLDDEVDVERIFQPFDGAGARG